MKQNSIRVAVTGGIGSGKSTICKIIKELGYGVYSCDDTYAYILNDKNYVSELAGVFGREIVNEDGSLNRGVLSDIVFSDEAKLLKLNKITHPKIFEEMFHVAELEHEIRDKLLYNIPKIRKHSIDFFEVPLLFECGYEAMFDSVVVVERDIKERIKSVMERDGLTEEQVINRINNQFDYSSLDFTKYYVIHNNCDKSQLCREITRAIAKIAESAGN